MSQAIHPGNSATYRSPVSLWEAQQIIETFPTMKPESPLQAYMIQQSILQNKRWVDDLQSGRAYHDGISPQAHRIRQQVKNLLLEGTDLPSPKSFELADYPKILQTPEIFSTAANSSFVPLSQANFENLKKNSPMGSINPPMKEIFFPSSELLVPLPNGFHSNLGLAEFYPNSKAMKFTAPEAKHKQVKIIVPRQGHILPMPNNAELASIQTTQAGEIKIAKPTQYDPVVWRHNLTQGELSYTIQEFDEAQRVNLSQNSDLIPSREEQEYWAQALPLPEILKHKIKESPKDLLRLLVSYMALPDRETGLTNFTYQANADFNKFLEQNKKDMPLIVSELKAGHCDLLSWYLAALIRAHGKPAWVSRGLVTTKNGDAFQGAYGHSTVMTLDDSGNILQIDPTQYTKLDVAYLHEEFPADDFEKMAKKFSTLKTNKSKQKLLQNFKKVLANTRKDIAEKPEKQKRVRDQVSGLMSHLQTLASLKSANKIEASRQLTRQVVDYTNDLDANKEYSAQELLELLPYEDGERYFPDLTGSKKELLNIQVARENFAQLLTIVKRMKIPILEKLYMDGLPRGRPEVLKLNMQNSYSYKHFDKQCKYTYLDWSIAFSEIKLSDLIAYAEPLIRHNGDVGSIGDCSTSSLLASEDELLAFDFSDKFKNLLQQDILLFEVDCVHNNEYVYNIATGNEVINNITNTVDDYNNYNVSANYFYASFQKACKDKNFRTKFLAKVNKDERWFRRLAEFFISITRPMPTLTRDDRTFYKKYDPDFFCPLYLETDDQARLRARFRKDIKRVDQLASGIVAEDRDLREYSPRDSYRDINWKATARSDKIYVNKRPYLEVGTSSPLHVLLSCSFHKSRVADALKVIELIAALQEDMKKTNREVYLAFEHVGFYIKLDKRADPKVIFQSLATTQNKKGNASYLDSKGKPFTNMLFLTDNYQKLSALTYIYSGIRRANFHGVYLKDKDYQVYPLLKKDFVENGWAK
jgi:hypothetical protein